MDTIYNLGQIIDYIKTQVPTAIVQKDTKFELEYLIYNIEENDLINKIQFTYIGKDFMNNKPMYRKSNLECFYDEAILHIYDTRCK